jgi:hypothetical protein
MSRLSLETSPLLGGSSSPAHPLTGGRPVDAGGRFEHDDVESQRRRQLQEDAELARQLQAQEREDPSFAYQAEGNDREIHRTPHDVQDRACS